MATKRSVGTLGDKDLMGKKVFLHADLNVLLDLHADVNVLLDDSQNITDDNGIRASMPSINFLMGKGAKVILANHLVSTRFSICACGVIPTNLCCFS